MLNTSDYYALYLAKQKASEMQAYFKNEDIKKKARLNKKKRKNMIIAHILEGAGNALVSTGNKLLRIA